MRPAQQGLPFIPVDIHMTKLLMEIPNMKRRVKKDSP